MLIQGLKVRMSAQCYICHRVEEFWADVPESGAPVDLPSMWVAVTRGHQDAMPVRLYCNDCVRFGRKTSNA